MHAMSDFIDDIKESLTDAQYKQGMELCQTLFKQKQEKLWRMTYLAPFAFVADHDCDDVDCDMRCIKISFTRKTALVQLTEVNARRILEKNMFLGTAEEMKPYVDVDILKNFPVEADDLGMPMEWDEFPVLALELIE